MIWQPSYVSNETRLSTSRPERSLRSWISLSIDGDARRPPNRGRIGNAAPREARFSRGLKDRGEPAAGALALNDLLTVTIQVACLA
jgi:hypothetical protein